MKKMEQIFYIRFTLIGALVFIVALGAEVIRANKSIDEFVNVSLSEGRILSESLKATLSFKSRSDFVEVTNQLDFENRYISIELLESDLSSFSRRGLKVDRVTDEKNRRSLSFKYLQLYFPLDDGALVLTKSVSRLHNAILTDFAIFLVMTCILAIALLYFGRKISRELASPVMLLNLAFKKFIDSGVLEPIEVKESYSLETLELNNSFRELIEQLMISKAELETLNEDLEERIAIKTRDLSKALENMKKFQKKLVAQEKLASLGSLSAGVAHEIKNPLNLVTNAAKIIASSSKNIMERRALFEKGEITRDELDALIEEFEDLIVASEIVSKNTDRADGIIRSMLNQSRSDERVLEFVNFSELLDRVISLSYHAMRAKHHNFEVNIIKELNQGIGGNCFAIDMERAIVNILENAFYALQEKKKVIDDSSYISQVKISLQREGDSFIFAFEDNGTGIKDDVKSRMLEPFYTTKPAGEGTGLGMAMVHDIVSAHNGEMIIESDYGHFTRITLKIDARLGRVA